MLAACKLSKGKKSPAGGGAASKASVVLAARPDQAVVVAALGGHQVRIQRGREGRVVEHHRQVLALAVLRRALPGGADLEVARQDAVVRCIRIGLVGRDDFDFDVDRQGANGAGEAVFACGEGSDCRHDDLPFVIEVAPIAALSVSDRAGNGRAASFATAAQRRTWSAQKICRRGRQRRGKIFVPESCGNGARGAADSSPGFPTFKAAGLVSIGGYW